jgi:hypothetical protein
MEDTASQPGQEDVEELWSELLRFYDMEKCVFAETLEQPEVVARIEANVILFVDSLTNGHFKEFELVTMGDPYSSNGVV